MAEKDIFSEREHWLEEEYFRKQNQMLVEQLRQQTAQEADRQRLAEITGIKDEEALAGLQELGFSAETIELLHLAPLVEVAWAEGGVTDRQRELIIKLARMRGIDENSTADRKLTEWLSERPSHAFFEACLSAERLLLEALPPDERERNRDDLIAHCNRIARVIYGRMWGHEVIQEEEQMIAHIAEELGWKPKS